jgi:SAM-dependent methyltransferase
VALVTPSLSPGYFDRLYTENEDPWGFSHRWYEQRKRALTMASLPRLRFRSAFEPGCSIGLTSELLAQRCDRLLSTDVARAAVDQARARLARFPSARVERARVPQQWPDGEFDLVLLSELAYYLDVAGAAALGRAAAASLSDDGVVVVCHWRHEVPEYPLNGDEAQRIVCDATGLDTLAVHRERDFLLHVLTPRLSPSVAEAEGLVRP